MTGKRHQPAAKPSNRRSPRIIKLDATPEEVARAIFAAAKPPDPSKRKQPGKRVKSTA